MAMLALSDVKLLVSMGARELMGDEKKCSLSYSPPPQLDWTTMIFVIEHVLNKRLKFKEILKNFRFVTH
jgi:hypothetical protein